MADEFKEIPLDTGKKEFVGDYSPRARELLKEAANAKTPEKRAEIRNEAREIREDILREKEILANTRNLIEQVIVENPQISPQELGKRINLDQFPESLQKVITGAVEEFQRDNRLTKEAYDHFMAKASREPAPDEEPYDERELRIIAGKNLYSLLTKNKAKDDCEMKKSSFGVWLVVYGGEDFKRLDKRDVDGHYDSSCEVRDGIRWLQFPLIVTKVDRHLEIIKHEEAHGQHAEIMTGMYSSSKELQWKLWPRYWISRPAFFISRSYAFLAQVLEKVPFLDSKALNFKEQAIGQFHKEATMLIERSLGRAKNELLAEFYNPDGNLENMLYQLKKVRRNKSTTKTVNMPASEDEKEEGAVYDFLTNGGLQDMERNSFFGQAAADIRKQYYGELDKAAGSLIELVKGWNMIGLDKDHKRHLLVYGMLISENIKNWGGFIKRYFGEETRVLNEIYFLNRKAYFEQVGWDSLMASLELAGEGLAGRISKIIIQDKTNQEGLINNLQEKVVSQDGEISVDDYIRTRDGLLDLLKEQKEQNKLIQAEKEKLIPQYEEKIKKTQPARAAKALLSKEESLKKQKEYGQELWFKFQETITGLEERFGTELWPGIFYLEKHGELPEQIEASVQNKKTLRYEKRIFNFTNPEIRQAIFDLLEVRENLNLGTSRLIDHEVGEKLRQEREKMFDYVNDRSWEPVFNRYLRLAIPTDKGRIGEVKTVLKNVSESQVKAKEEFNFARDLLGKYEENMV